MGWSNVKTPAGSRRRGSLLGSRSVCLNPLWRVGVYEAYGYAYAYESKEKKGNTDGQMHMKTYGNIVSINRRAFDGGNPTCCGYRCQAVFTTEYGHVQILYH